MILNWISSFCCVCRSDLRSHLVASRSSLSQMGLPVSLTFSLCEAVIPTPLPLRRNGREGTSTKSCHNSCYATSHFCMEIYKSSYWMEAFFRSHDFSSMRLPFTLLLMTRLMSCTNVHSEINPTYIIFFFWLNA